MYYFTKVKNTALTDGMPTPLATLIAAQAAHESGGFSSHLFRIDNNTFGYKYTGSIWQDGPGLLSPEGDHYAHYSTIVNSTHELTAWIHRRLKEERFPPLDQITTPAEYAAALKKDGYYGDTLANYTAGITERLSEYQGKAV